MRRARGESGNSLVELVVIVAVALGLALGIQAFLVKPYRIPSESMVPTLEIGQRVLVNRIGSRFSAPDIGQVTVFHPPVGSETNQCGAPQRDGQPCPRAPGDRRGKSGPPAMDLRSVGALGDPNDSQKSVRQRAGSDDHNDSGSQVARG